MKAFLLSVLALALLAPAGFGAVIDCTTAPVTISTASLGSGGTNVCAGLNGETFSGFTLASGFGVGTVPTVDNTNTQVQILVSGPTTYVVFTPVTPGGWNIAGVAQYTINATYTYNTNQANFYIAFFNGSATGAGSVSLTKALGSPAGVNGAVNVSTGGNGQPCASPIGGFTCSPLSSVTPGPFSGALLITDNFQLNASGSSASASAFGDAFGVPEPATLGSMGLGLLMVGFLARRKRA